MERYHKQILASDLFIQTNSFSLIKWKWWKWWKRRPWIRWWCFLLFSSSSLLLLCWCHRRHRRHGCCHHHYHRCFGSLTVLCYCLYVNYTVVPYTHRHPHIVGSIVFLFSVRIIRSHKVTLYEIPRNDIEIKYMCVCAWSHGSTFPSLNFALLCFALVCSNRKWQMWSGI